MNIHDRAQNKVVKYDERIGQAYYNAAYELDPDWASLMATTIDDPFNNDNVLHYFLAHWQEDHPEE